MAGRIPRRLSFPARHKMSACPNLFDLIYQQGCLFTRELAAEAAAALLFNANVSSGWTRDGSGRFSAPSADYPPTRERQRFRRGRAQTSGEGADSRL